LSALPALSSTAEPCGANSTRVDAPRLVKGEDHPLRLAPSKSAERLVNKKATAALGRIHYAVIDLSAEVIEECTRGDWSRVHVDKPEWLRDSHVGWVPSDVLKGESRDARGYRAYTENDFSWDKNTRPHKAIIVAGVNKVHRENARCRDIDTGSAYISGSKGTKKNPVFFVTCGTGRDAHNVFFSKSDIEAGRTLGAAKHIDRSRGIALCEAYAKNSARHPSTVSFSRIMDLAVDEHPNGRTTVSSSFMAKNSFNLELKHGIRCLLDENGLIEAHVSETSR
jgi:hypothetical protein